MSNEMQNSECRMQNYVSSNKTVDNCFLRNECAETRSDASEACPHEQDDYVSRVEMQNYEDEAQNSDVNAEEVAEAALPTDEPSSTAHLASSLPKIASAPKGAMTKSQLREARELFPDLSDGEIFRLYKKVTN